jgi:phospholipid transport system substrate-binding protein
MSQADTADIKFGEEKKTDDGTEVYATATAQGSEIHLVFKMKPKDKGGWLVTDVVIDDVSLVRNYRSQFQKTLATSSFNDLQAKLQKKAAELRGSNDTTAKNDVKTKEL